MKFAVISDIHGNMSALNAILEDIKKQKCDKILCLGDLALAGPEPVDVVKFVKNQTEWTVIQGNTDYMIGNFTEEGCNKVKEAFPAMGNALEYDKKEMTQELRDYLKNLKSKFEIKIEDVKILMVHGSPRENDENIFPDMEPLKVEEIVKNTDADLILCGHTHIPCGYQLESKKTIVNVGSVGRSMVKGGKACYAIVEVLNGKMFVEHRFCDYNREESAQKLAERGYAGAADIAKLLINPTSRHV